jgi:hypothetical protein
MLGTSRLCLGGLIDYEQFHCALLLKKPFANQRWGKNLQKHKTTSNTYSGGEPQRNNISQI